MLDLDFRAKPDLRSRGGDPHSQLDIFHARPTVIFKKSADLEKHAAADDSEARPKRRGLPTVLLVCVVMEKIAVLGQESGVRRCIIVRAESGRQFRIVHRGPDRFDRASRDDDITVNEQQQPIGGQITPGIPRSGRPHTPFERQNAHSVFPFQRVVTCAIDNENNFVAKGDGGTQRPQTLFNTGRKPENGYDDAQAAGVSQVVGRKVRGNYKSGSGN